MSVRPRVLLVVGYFDWFSGYQETALAAAFRTIADTEVVCSDRVSPAFGASELSRLGVPRRYPSGSRREHGVTVTRLPSQELRSMVWSRQVRGYLAGREADLIIQVMPGQVFSAAGSLTRHHAPRLTLYGDNRAMWSHLPRYQRILKGAAFSVSKGVLYAVVNARSRGVYGYTPDTQRRLRAFAAGHRIELLPLAFSAERFFFDAAVRSAARRDFGYAAGDVVLLSAGKFRAAKRLEWLVSAFDRVAAERPALRLLLLGADDSAYSDGIRELVRNSAYAPRIAVRDFVDADGLNAVFNAADLGVWPRNPAITIQQAMGTGLAVLLPTNDLVGHLVRPGTGRYYTPGEGEPSEALADALAAAADELPFGTSARLDRCVANGWLSADHLAQRLLADARRSR